MKIQDKVLGLLPCIKLHNLPDLPILLLSFSNLKSIIPIAAGTNLLLHRSLAQYLHMASVLFQVPRFSSHIPQ